ncbi:hypothetical protein [Alteribacillus sp. HJP-4]|uniref:hypothetical protein n=1 Tax=Alteribacillus sp. HJP-4 TaxID=2775394 RepID=UPI0035CCF0CD
MIRMQGGIYYTWLYGHSLKLVYLGGNKCELHINGDFTGICSFDYTRKKIYEMERYSRRKRLNYPGHNIFESAKKGTMINIII